MTNEANAGKTRVKRKKTKQSGRNITEIVIAGSAVATSTILLTSMPELITDYGSIGSKIKGLVLAIGAGGIGYGVNKIAIERGAPLGAIGFRTASLASITSIAIVGAGLWTSTFPALTLRSVAELQIQEFGSELVRFVGYRNQKADEGARVVPLIEAISNEQNQYAQCEISSSCVSKRGNGGYGPVAKELETLSNRGAGIAVSIALGAEKKQESLDLLNDYLEEFQQAANDPEKDIWQRRPKLERISARIDQTISQLDEAIPLAQLDAYADELVKGVQISGRPVATQNLGAILRKQANSLSRVLDDVEVGDKSRPQFPPRPGVSTTFSYIGHFLPLAAIAAVVELIFPLSLWVFTYLTRLWQIERIEDDENEPDEPPQDGFHGLINLPTFKSKAVAQASKGDENADNVEALPTPAPRERKGRGYPPRVGRGKS